MTGTISYKHFIAAFLLGLYLFITAPVQLWHHHNNSSNKKPVTASQQDVVSTDNNSLSDANCSICSHKYSTYSGVTLIHFSPSPVVTAATYGGYQLIFTTTAVSTRSNKGPPVLS